MSSLAAVFSSITSDIYTEKNSDEYLSFFYTSMLHYAISLEIASSSYKGEFISFQKLYKTIPKKLGCKSSIKSILNHGVEKTYFIKEQATKDKRIKKYKLSESYSLMITDWYLSRKSRYASQ